MAEKLKKNRNTAIAFLVAGIAIAGVKNKEAIAPIFNTPILAEAGSEEQQRDERIGQLFEATAQTAGSLMYRRMIEAPFKDILVYEDERYPQGTVLTTATESATKRYEVTIAMLKEDHGDLDPLTTYGITVVQSSNHYRSPTSDAERRIIMRRDPENAEAPWVVTSESFSEQGIDSPTGQIIALSLTEVQDLSGAIKISKETERLIHTALQLPLSSEPPPLPPAPDPPLANSVEI